MRFILFQPIPRKGIVYVWIDGGSRKRFKIPDFLNVIKEYEESLWRSAAKAIETYSFYLIDLKNLTFNHLTPNYDRESIIKYLNTLYVDKNDDFINQKIFALDKSNIFLDLLDNMINKLKGKKVEEIPTFKDTDVKLIKMKK